MGSSGYQVAKWLRIVLSGPWLTASSTPLAHKELGKLDFLPDITALEPQTRVSGEVPPQWASEPRPPLVRAPVRTPREAFGTEQWRRKADSDGWEKWLWEAGVGPHPDAESPVGKSREL